MEKQKQIMRPLGGLGLADLIAELPENFIMAEIGCFAGESTAFFAAKARKVYAIDPWADYIDESSQVGATYKHGVKMDGVEERFDAVAKKYPNIVKLKGRSEDVVRRFADRCLDAVYIDGDHHYKAVSNDIRLWLPKIRPDGIICGHDFGYFDVSKAVRGLIGEPHRIYVDNSWGKRLPSNETEYEASIAFARG